MIDISAFTIGKGTKYFWLFISIFFYLLFILLYLFELARKLVDHIAFYYRQTSELKRDQCKDYYYQ